ncbi:hypothetical protein DFP72DRAFT_841677 [Ephemerocybe angulata]|uniref:Uncharacterized protein n=1 Tax=Ephemerocybe angulata TaxID=980116 RepID=A0A8H6IBL5_9AGAR|nr:hypothetical protein DFP72DRAFT_841677 [Tulosesus angulatus]
MAGSSFFFPNSLCKVKKDKESEDDAMLIDELFSCQIEWSACHWLELKAAVEDLDDREVEALSLVWLFSEFTIRSIEYPKDELYPGPAQKPQLGPDFGGLKLANLPNWVRPSLAWLGSVNNALMKRNATKELLEDAYSSSFGVKQALMYDNQLLNQIEVIYKVWAEFFFVASVQS